MSGLIIRYTYHVQVGAARVEPKLPGLFSSMAQSLINKHTLNRFVGRLAAGYVKWVFHSSTSLSDIDELRAIAKQHQPCIFAFWHGQFMLIPNFSPPKTPVAIMVARHGDAELIGEVLKSFDQMTLIRGGGAGNRKKNRGGSTALRAAVRALEQGTCLSMTADVPPGPARIAGHGILKIAQMSGRPILPVATTSSRLYAMRTWSRMTINLPYSKIAMRLGTPIYVPRDADDAQLEVLRQKLQDALNEVTGQVYADVGVDIVKATPYSALSPEAPPEPAGFKLKLYQTAARLTAKIAPLILLHREKRGKEDPARRQERFGIASHVRPDGPLVWLHAASVGETNAVLPLLHRLREEFPGPRYLLTTGTITSAKIAQERLPDGDIHQFAPIDAPEFVKRFLDYWQPELALLTESEIWPNMILACHERGIPVAIINGRMSERSYRLWRKHKSMAVPVFGRLRLVLAQNERLVRHFHDLGARDVRCAGNIKIDAPKLPYDEAERARLAEAFSGRSVWAAVSTHAGESEAVVKAHVKLAADFTDLVTIFAPRHPERANEISDLAAAADIKTARRSMGEWPDSQTGIYIFDTIGELGLLYSLAKIAFIGGSLVNRGGQNPIEAVRFETAIITGPDQSNFSDSYRALLRNNGAIQVSNFIELAGAVRQLLRDEVEHGRLTHAASSTLDELAGGLETTVEALKPIMPQDNAISQHDERIRVAS